MPHPSPHRLRHIFIVTSIVIVTTVFCLGGYFLWKGLSVTQSVTLHNDTATPSLLSTAGGIVHSLFGSTTALKNDHGRINILLLGRAGTHYPGKNLTDTVIILSIDTTTKRAALLSLPRDLYVPVADTDLYTKLNSVYQYGLSTDDSATTLRKTVENITGLPIHYFVALDFDGFEKIIDALGGIRIDVVRDFLDTSYPGKNYSYETFSIKKGWQTLDGATALKYVRERHNDPEGDFGRAKRQQQVIQAAKEKSFTINTFLNPFTLNSFLSTLGESVRTDISPDEIGIFLTLAKNIDTHNVTTVVVDAWKTDSLLRVSHIDTDQGAMFTLVPRSGNWSEVRDMGINLFSLDEIKTHLAAVAGEHSSLLVITRPENATAATHIVDLATHDFGFDTATIRTDTTISTDTKSLIADHTGGTKPYSLDELLKKFMLTRTDTLSITLPPSKISSGTPQKTGPDFIIVLGNDLADELYFDANSALHSNQDAFDNAFSVPTLPQKKR